MYLSNVCMESGIVVGLYYFEVPVWKGIHLNVWDILYYRKVDRVVVRSPHRAQLGFLLSLAFLAAWQQPTNGLQGYEERMR